MKTQDSPKAADVKKGISVLWETLQCPICLELMTAPVSTKCDHQFCKFCMMKLLDNSKQNRASCPVCKARVTRRSLQESPGFKKLVAGLQDMIQAYEHDTGSNYFTGQMLPKHPAVVTDVVVQKNTRTNEDLVELENLEKPCSEDAPKSQSSTIKAQNGFARLMGLEDTSPLTTENEGLDSGLGEPPATPEKKYVTPDILELIAIENQASENAQPTHKTRVLIKCSDLPPLILEEENAENNKDDEEEHDDSELPSKKSRKKHKKDSGPDKILKRRQRKSVEKVREWLMNVPNKEDIELDKLDKDAQYLDDSDSFSSSSTIDLKQHNYESFLNEKEGVTKALEDQVFGAVYKRGKKRNGKEISPPPDILTHLNSNDAMDQQEDEAINKSDTEKEPDLRNLVDDNSEFFKVVVPLDKEVHNESYSDKQPQQELDELHNVRNECKEKEDSPLRKTGSHKRRGNSRKKMCNELKQVDIDLQEQAKMEPENGEQKKTDKKKGRHLKSSKVKSGRVTKPLDLVEVQKGETALMEEPKSKLESDQIHVHIENYPSSEEQEVSVVKSTRRSRRLQNFVEEIRVSKKKSHLKGTNSYQGKTSEEVQVVLAKNNTSPQCANTNGCIYADDLGGIEKIGSYESPNILKPTQPLQEVPNVEILTEDACCEPDAPDCPKTSGEDINTVQESDIQTDPKNVQLESMGCDDEIEEQMEEDKSDSEIDTEQLLRSFKATKRKSFHLEAPNVKRSCSLDERDAQKPEDGDFILRNQAVVIEETPIQYASLNHSNSLFSDVIPPSPTHAQNEAQDGSDMPSNPISNNCSNSSSSLTPNKVSKLETPSYHLSVIPHIADSGLHFTAGKLSDSVGPKKQSTNRPLKCTHISESLHSKSEDNSVSLLDPSTTKNLSPGNKSQHLLNTDYSLTPDGLLTRPFLNEKLAQSHGSSSTQSSIQNNPRRRRSRRLESSPELDSSGSKEELPSLAQILKCNSSSSRDKSQQENVASIEINEGLTVERDQVIRPPPCPSPDYVNSSQASVDLFGTPEESSGVPVNNASISVEMSQLSSEVLVTQQKVEMQKELVRLEKLMALVSEVLHEKENGPENDTEQNGEANAPEPTRPQASNEDTGQDSENNDPPSSGLRTLRRPSGVKAATKSTIAKHDPTTDTVFILAQSSAHKDLAAAAATKTVATSSSTQSHKTRECLSEDKENQENETRKPKMVLVSSGLGPSEQIMVKKFAKRIGSRVVSHVMPDVTHIIMHTDEQLVCERTLKYFLGIAGRKWVVSFQWISECFKQKKLLDESLFEVKGDVVNGHNHQGPMRARTTNDDDLLMKRYKICFEGPFTDMTTDEMGWMAELCGATVVKDPSVLDGKQKSRQLIVVQSGSDISASKYNSLSRVATVVTRGWLLDSVSAYTIKNCKNYTI
ncbi:breast cancer type 1 susceptibility protein homolog isoform X2 [Boleophthalmus pectinirostris]|uniref:breast cancer type 1 susceptibility protein homolog isoform X2 n=1 Tax=Boleophthalmus pectinirostris TaxID=150288 RepID=UPI002431FBAE|nr:breast cancer type 1 susceptibility protein homolog isoform X2 [Boleophthalmus pectinirostris]